MAGGVLALLSASGSVRVWHLTPYISSRLNLMLQIKKQVGKK